MNLPNDDSRLLLNEDQAAAMLGVSVSMLVKLRAACRHNAGGRQGPAYVKLGKSVRYRIADLEAWIENSLVRPATSPARPIRGRPRKTEPGNAVAA
ncbi:helix-turn-helix transcriptional regulator [Acetobacter sp. UBA5411]|uniref:helix-turn-helix transcriptional regulator n=1 Tax=Acetobacter sp. UBA5411 TaxID=1945905 RepID=UPI0025BECC5C|nr:helix-turn-helix domain-containing protein [Acetobacter sp. UBA5411]